VKQKLSNCFKVGKLISGRAEGNKAKVMLIYADLLEERQKVVDFSVLKG
jgi:hypothetical protein